MAAFTRTNNLFSPQRFKRERAAFGQPKGLTAAESKRFAKGQVQPMMRPERQKKKKTFPALALRVGVFGLCVYLCVSLVFLQVDIVAKRKQLENLQQQTAAQEAENQELMRLRDDSDEDAYMERIAREKLGYVLPGEHIYVDMAGG